MTSDRLSGAESRLKVKLPRTLRELYEQGDGRFRDDGQWWVVWPIERLVEEALGAWQRGLPQSLLPFGDDGAGDPFCLGLRAPSDLVVKWSWIDGAVETTEGS